MQKPQPAISLPLSSTIVEGARIYTNTQYVKHMLWPISHILQTFMSIIHRKVLSQSPCPGPQFCCSTTTKASRSFASPHHTPMSNQLPKLLNSLLPPGCQ